MLVEILVGLASSEVLPASACSDSGRNWRASTTVRWSSRERRSTLKCSSWDQWVSCFYSRPITITQDYHWIPGPWCHSNETKVWNLWISSLKVSLRRRRKHSELLSHSGPQCCRASFSLLLSLPEAGRQPEKWAALKLAGRRRRWWWRCRVFIGPDCLLGFNASPVNRRASREEERR